MPDALAYLGIGSNLGDRAAFVRAAVDALGQLQGTRVVALSAVIETDPVGPIEQGPYLNAVAGIETGLGPRTLLGELHRIERAHRRDRATERRWGPRTLDLDILAYADRHLADPGLTIPHPRPTHPLFVLRPLAEVAPELTVPGTGRTVSGLLATLEQGGSA